MGYSKRYASQNVIKSAPVKSITLYHQRRVHLFMPLFAERSNRLTNEIAIPVCSILCISLNVYCGHFCLVILCVIIKLYVTTDGDFNSSLLHEYKSMYYSINKPTIGAECMGWFTDKTLQIDNVCSVLCF